MALQTDFLSLDLERRGFPFAQWFNATLTSDLYSLDYEGRGVPLVMQLAVIPQDTNTVTLSSNEVEIVVVRRKFPNKRQEMVGETQIKQVVPLFGAQYVLYLP